MASFDVGSITAKVTADVTQFKQGIAEAQNKLEGFKTGVNNLNDSLAGVRTMATIVGGVAIAGLGAFLQDASQKAGDFERSMITLEIISGRFGVSADKAKLAAKELGTELRIGPGVAAESLQNLLKSGLNLPQSTELLKRFTNEALTGKSPTISLGQAVQNLSFAYATNNSALGNLSGISENFQNIIDKGREALIKEGKAAGDVTDDMAKLRGMMDLTNLTMGASERLANSYTTKQEILRNKIDMLKISIGEKLNPVLSRLTEGLTAFVSQNGDKIVAFFVAFIDVATKFGQWVAENQDLVIGFLKGFGAALLVLTSVSFITSALVALMNPITWLIVGITLLFTAWQTNFLGIRDITNVVVTGIVWFFNNILMPAIVVLVGFFREHWSTISLVVESAWNLITTIITAAVNLLTVLFGAWLTNLVMWFKTNWDMIKLAIDSTWKVIIGIIQVASAIISGIFIVLTAMITGNWDEAFKKLSKVAETGWNGIKNIFSGIIGFIAGWGGSILASLVRPFQDAWNKISELVNKIKDGLDFTKRHSPSVVDTVKKGVGLVNDALSGLQYDTMLSPTMVAQTVSNGGKSMSVASINIDLNGAIIGSTADATSLGESIGDSIIKKLQYSIRV